MPDGSRGEQRRAYALLEIKSFDDDARTFEGIASTPSVDLGGDIMDPMGAQFTLPIPLMWQHGKGAIKDPVGWVTSAAPNKSGIPVKGRFAKVDFPLSLKEDLDRAWALVKSKLVRGLSIGWTPIDGTPEKGGNVRWTKWGWRELSAVHIPMNTEASITLIKSLDLAARASSGRSAPPGPPGASGKPQPASRRFFFDPSKGKAMKTNHEQLADLQTAKTEKGARMEALASKCGGDFESLETTELQEYDALTVEVKSIAKQIERVEGIQIATSTATPITLAAGASPQRGSAARHGDAQMKSNLPKGTMFARAVMAKAKGKGSTADAVSFAKAAWPDAPEVVQYLEKATAGTGASGNWLENLNTPNFVENDFIAALLPATIIGKIAFRPGMFDTKLLRQLTGASNTGWVGNTGVKPVGEQTWDFVTIPRSKIADIVVLSEDQIKTSHINSVEMVRNDLINQISKFANAQLLDPNVVAVAGTNPASLTNGVNDIPASAATAAALRVDLKDLLTPFAAANIDLGGVTLVTTTYVAMGISLLTNALGQPEFPTVNVNGGTLFGLPLVVSNNVPGTSTGSLLVAIAGQEVLLAQDGGVQVDVSREATLEMSGGATATFNLWQRNCVGFRAEWWISWIKARPQAVQYISGAAYAPA